MKKRLLAILFAFALLLSLLSGCGQSSSARFFDQIDDILSMDDYYISAILPYHGASMAVDGFVSRSAHSADLTLSLKNIDGSEKKFTQLIVSENELWLDVDSPALCAMSFDLNSMWMQDMEELAEAQYAPWVHLQWEGDLWTQEDKDSVLRSIWTDSKNLLSPYITGSGNNCRLTLEDESADSVMQFYSDALTQKTPDLQADMEEKLTAQPILLQTLPSSASDFMQDLVYGVLDIIDPLHPDELDEIDKAVLIEEGYTDEEIQEYLLQEEQAREQAQLAYDQRPTKLVAEVTQTDNTKALSMLINDTDSAVITFTTLEAAPEISIPDAAQVMPLSVYSESFYYLFSFADTYISATLSGDDAVFADLEAMAVQVQQQQEMLEEAAQRLKPADSQPDQVYQLLPFSTGEHELNVPVLSSFTEVTFSTTEEDDQVFIDFNAEGEGWFESVYPEYPEALPADAAQLAYDNAAVIYNNYFFQQDYLPIIDLQPAVVSQDGRIAAAGFSYLENNYAPAKVMMITVITSEDGSESCVLELELTPDQMSHTDLEAVAHIFQSLGLPLPTSLDI